MKKLTIIKKFKAYFIRLKLHRYFGFMADLLIFFGYMLKLSSWVENNKKSLAFNDFYNNQVKHKDRERLYQYVTEKLELKNKPITYLEFGVAGGSSLRWWSASNEHPETTYWAFDTFIGLPKQYGHYKIGAFDQKGNFPNIEDDRIKFIKGLFQDTLLNTLEEIDFERQCLIHIDGDLYSSALYTLTMLYSKLKPGDIILFDEFGVPYHEFKAYDDFIKSFYLTLKPIGAINNYLQVAFEVIRIDDRPVIE